MLPHVFVPLIETLPPLNVPYPAVAVTALLVASFTVALLALVAEDEGGDDGQDGQADDDVGQAAGVVAFDA